MGLIVPLRKSGFQSAGGSYPAGREGSRALWGGFAANHAAEDAVSAQVIGRQRPRREAPLDCLSGAALTDHFHSWRGASGKRYICSVYPVRIGEKLGGLPEFDSAIGVAVGRDSQGRRQKHAVFASSWSDGRFDGDLKSVGNALRLGAAEWHIHLLATDIAARRVAIKDIAS